MKKNYKLWTLILLMGITLIFTICVTNLKETEKLYFNDEKTMDFNIGWEYENKNGSWTKVSLPANLEREADSELILKNTIPSNLTSDKYFCFRASLQSLTVEIDGTVVHEYGKKNLISKTSGSAWRLVKVPAFYSGKEIVIKLSSPYGSHAGIVNKIFYGSKGAIFFEIIRQHKVEFILSIIIFLIGFFMMLTYILNRAYLFKNRGTLYLGLFCCLIAIWMLSETRMLQFFTDSQVLISMLPFLSFMLFPIPFLLFIEESCLTKTKSITKVCFWVLVSMFGTNMVLQVFKLRDFYENLLLSHVIVGVIGILLYILMVYEYMQLKNKKVKPYMKAFSLLLGFMILSLGIFYFSPANFSPIITSIGILLFVIFLSSTAFEHIKEIAEETRGLRYYEKLAYEDLLTGALNRTAYYKEVEEEFRPDNVPNGKRLILFDLNNLKVINDTMGHQMGDIALKSCYNCIKETFGFLGHCFRLGGDEFACIILKHNTKDFEQKKKEFLDKMYAINDAAPFDFCIAMGESTYHSDIDKNFESFSNRVDKVMYQNKAELKKGQCKTE